MIILDSNPKKLYFVVWNEMIKRELQNIIELKLNKGKAIILIGARQVGKTTLLKSMFQTTDNLLLLNGDELDIQNLFSNISSTRLRQIGRAHV